MQEIVVGSRYLAISWDEVIRIDNQSWISIHCYVIQNWCHLFVLISLEQVIEGRGFDNMIKMIMDVLKKHTSVFNANVVAKLLSFGANGVNVFPRDEKWRYTTITK